MAPDTCSTGHPSLLPEDSLGTICPPPIFLLHHLLSLRSGNWVTTQCEAEGEEYEERNGMFFMEEQIFSLSFFEPVILEGKGNKGGPL